MLSLQVAYSNKEIMFFHTNNVCPRRNDMTTVNFVIVVEHLICEWSLGLVVQNFESLLGT